MSSIGDELDALLYSVFTKTTVPTRFLAREVKAVPINGAGVRCVVCSCNYIIQNLDNVTIEHPNSDLTGKEKKNVKQCCIRSMRTAVLHHKQLFLTTYDSHEHWDSIVFDHKIEHYINDGMLHVPIWVRLIIEANEWPYIVRCRILHQLATNEETRLAFDTLASAQAERLHTPINMKESIWIDEFFKQQFSDIVQLPNNPEYQKSARERARAELGLGPDMDFLDENF